LILNAERPATLPTVTLRLHLSANDNRKQS
jgi:hypothetical protein